MSAVASTSAAGASAAGAGDPFAQHNSLQSQLNYLRVPELQAMIKESHHFWRGPRISYQGRKAELIQRLLDVANSYEKNRTPENIALYKKFNDLLLSKKNLVNGTYSYGRGYNGATVPQALGALPTPAYGASLASTAPGAANASPAYPQTPGYASAYPKAAPAVLQTPTYAAPVPQTGRFASSPFHKFQGFIGQIVKATRGPHERKRVLFRLTLSQQQFDTIKGPSATHTLVLMCSQYDTYCASSIYSPAPMEFPVQAEVRVNLRPLAYNFRGTKKAPGRVAPPDLNKLGDGPGAQGPINALYNTIEFWYVAAYKDYACAIAYVEKISVENILADLETRIMSKEQVLAKMKAAAQDDDIVAGTATVSLKDPMSLIKMLKPARSRKCDHVQCFDAGTFLRANQESHSWICPICSSKLNWNDIVIDGYMRDIISKVGQNVESVLVEADGTWRVPGQRTPETESARTKEDRGISTEAGSSSARHMPINIDSSPPAGASRRIGLGGSSRPSGSGVSTPQQNSGVIDLTLDSDDDDDGDGDGPIVMSTSMAQKRRAIDDDDDDSDLAAHRRPAQQPKRTHSFRPAEIPRTNGATSNGGVNGAGPINDSEADDPTASQNSRLADGTDVSPEMLDRFFREPSV